MTEDIRLTQYSHGAGCGCKIAPKVLEEILQPMLTVPDKKLLVGNQTSDDAAVYDLGNGTALVTTTDFFMPIVDDAFDFGRIAAANSISDVFAMGGKPVIAIAILGWPVEKLPVHLAQKVLEGARSVCAEAGISLAGGHSIESPEPMFGLAVNGLVDIEHIKRNNTAKEGDWIFLTKPLGVGILSTAQKRGLLQEQHQLAMVEQMAQLNKLGESLGKLSFVNAMTDVTGFGLLGHLIEMAGGSDLSAEVYYNKIQAAPGVREYIAQRIFPDATTRNWSAYSDKTKFEKGVNVMEAFTLLPDPQTNGGLLFSIANVHLQEAKEHLHKHGFANYAEPIGKFILKNEKLVYVNQ